MKGQSESAFLTNLAQSKQKQFSEDPSRASWRVSCSNSGYDLTWKDVQGVLSGWPKCPLGFFHKIVWKNLNEHFGQDNTYCTSEEKQNLDSSPEACWLTCWRPTWICSGWRCSPRYNSLELYFLDRNRSQETHDLMCIRRAEKVYQDVI